MTTLNYEYFQDGQKQLHSVGCSLITNDIRKLSSSLEDDKIIIFGTCSYIGEAENYSKFLITFLHKCFPEYKIYAAGCDVNFDKEFYKQFDESFTNEDLIEYSWKNIVSENDVSIKIQDGCHNNCSYCIINKLRKHPYSIHWRNIVNQISDKTINVELYGTEICQYDEGLLTTLPKLLERILEERPNIKTLSLSSIDPSSSIIFDLIEFIETHSQMIPHITLAVQSGSDKVLKDMRRHYDSNRLKEIHKFAKKHNVTIGWELIIGYPTETDELFNETLSLFNELKPINNTIFKYSPRPRTLSYDLEQIDAKIIDERFEKIKKIENDWLLKELEKSPLKEYFINVKHIIPDLTYNRLLKKYMAKDCINIISITSEESLIQYIRNQYFKKEAPKEIHLQYSKDSLFILKFLKEFLPDTKVVLEVDKNIDLNDVELLVDFGCLIRRI